MKNKDIGLSSELQFSTSRSSGPGGQHVNKTDTKVELRFSVINSTILVEKEKSIILKKMSNKITASGEIILTSQKSRSQLKNKEEAIRRFNLLIKSLLAPTKKRIPSKPTSSSKKKRLETKKKHSEKKARRSHKSE